LNKPLDSRELKLILNPKRFQDLNNGIDKFQQIVKSQIESLGGTFDKEKDPKIKHRRTWYLDTENFELKSKNFFFRIREEEGDKEYDVTLKCRHEDRYISSNYDLSNSIKTDYEVKFEEDIIAPYVSKFSMSGKYKDNENPEINSIGELKSIFPGLHNHGLKEGKLKKVNNFEAKENSCKIGKFIFDNNDNSEKEDNQIKTDLNLWYLPDDERIPLIVEFTFDYSAKKRKNDTDKLLMEEFPFSLVQNAYEFYHALQDSRIVDLESSKTKTCFVYNYKP
jgi:uncharacterized protein YjbK